MPSVASSVHIRGRRRLTIPCNVVSSAWSAPPSVVRSATSSRVGLGNRGSTARPAPPAAGAASALIAGRPASAAPAAPLAASFRKVRRDASTAPPHGAGANAQRLAHGVRHDNAV